MDWLETLIFAALATFKFAMAVPFFILEEKLSFWEGLLFSISSGTFGVILFMYLSTRLLQAWRWIQKKLGIWRNVRPKKIFTRKNRRIVWLKSRYGLIGIAVLTPILLSIPLGCFLAVRFYKNKRKVFLYMLGGIILWSFIFATSASIIIKLLKSIQVAFALL